MNFISEDEEPNNEGDNDDDDLINEGIVGKKYIALKPYIKMTVGTQKESRERQAKTHVSRQLLPRFESMPP